MQCLSFLLKPLAEGGLGVGQGRGLADAVGRIGVPPASALTFDSCPLGRWAL